jgi:hypothetical protein
MLALAEQRPFQWAIWNITYFDQGSPPASTITFLLIAGFGYVQLFTAGRTAGRFFPRNAQSSSGLWAARETENS